MFAKNSRSEVVLCRYCSLQAFMQEFPAGMIKRLIGSALAKCGKRERDQRILVQTEYWSIKSVLLAMKAV